MVYVFRFSYFEGLLYHNRSERAMVGVVMARKSRSLYKYWEDEEIEGAREGGREGWEKREGRITVHEL